MVFDKYVELEINGKKHKLCYPTKYVWKLERDISSGNILVMVSQAGNGIPPTLHDMFLLITYALMGGNPKLTEEDAEELYLEAVNEMTILELTNLAMQALQKSGVLGQEKKAPAAPKA